MITRNTFAGFWRSIFSKTKEVLKDFYPKQSEILLFEFQTDSISEDDLAYMAETMSSDRLFIQTVKLATDKSPNLQVVRTGNSLQLRLSLSK